MASFEDFVERYHGAAAEFVKGNPETYLTLFTERDDLTVANPWGPPRHGREEAIAWIERAASNWSDGEVEGFERIATFASDELVCILEIERYRARMGGEDLVSVALRVTSVLRLEDGEWRIVHRHADPITSPRTAESVIQS